MGVNGFRYIYGPVPSRRLGRSLGIDLVPYKVCTYDCVYCQLGRTTNKTTERRDYVPWDKALDELREALKTGLAPDYISLAGSGEPTLNSGIGPLIRGIKKITRIPVAVITNGSLLGIPEVRDSLMPADLVLPSLYAGDPRKFERINRPHKDITFDGMLEGLKNFIRGFPGRMFLEVFLVAGSTGSFKEVEKIASLVKILSPDRVQLNTVARPPSEDSARAVTLHFGRYIEGTIPPPE